MTNPEARRALPRAIALLAVAAMSACIGETIALPGARDADPPGVDAAVEPIAPDGGAARDDGGLVAAPDAGARLDAGAAQDGGAARDGGPIVSADCARGTWCWERPVPSGEGAIAAQAFEGDRAVALASSGTLARFDGRAWTLQLLDLGGLYPVGLWGEDPSELFVLATDSFSRRGRTLFRVDARGTTPLASVADESAWGLLGARRDAVYTLAERQLVRWDGAAWTSLGGPGGDVSLSSLALDGDGLLVLESWGSGSGSGILHRWQDGAWSRVVEFSGLGVRVDGPIVRGEGAWWLRGYDVRRGVVRLVRGDADGWRVVAAPTSDGELVAVGDRAWWVSGERAWRLVGESWQRVLGFPGRQYGTLVGHGEGAWVFGSVFASRGESGTWRMWGEAPRPSVGFVDVDASRATLFVGGPAALVSSAPSTPRAWREIPLGFEGPPVAADARPDLGAALVVDDTLVVADASGVRASHPLPEGIRAWGWVALAGPDHAWLTTGDGQLIEWRGAWAAPIDPPSFAEAPNSRATVGALHVTREGTLYAGVWTITGDKQVYQGVFAREAGGWRAVVEAPGVFGESSQLAIIGERDDALWIALGGLWRVDARGARRVDGFERLVTLAPAPGGGVLALESARIHTLTADAQVIDVLALPLARELFFAHVRRVGDVTYAATHAGQVIRYTR